MGSFEQTVKICTTDPMPLLVNVIRKYQGDGIYVGRGEIGDVDRRKPWTTSLWQAISTHVPADGVPLMLGIYSDAFSAGKKSHHVVRYASLLTWGCCLHNLTGLPCVLLG